MYPKSPLLILLAVSIFISCQKNQLTDTSTSETKTISNRTVENDQWLTDFQSYLRDLRDGVPNDAVILWKRL